MVRAVASMVVVVLALLAGAPCVLAQAVDTILVNGRIVTLDDRSTVAEAIAIRGDSIAAVGPSAQIRSLAGRATRVIDLAGRTVIPGLIDSHIHAIRAGLRFGREVSWTGARTVAEAMARITDAAARGDSGTWIVVAGGWTPQQFAERRVPTRAELAAAAPGRLVYVQLYYRSVLLSTKAAQALNIATDADAPPKGRVELGPDGKPTGWIHGNAPTITGIYGRLPQPTLEDSIAGTARFFRELNRYGLTGVIDPGGYNIVPQQYEALFRLWRRGGLTVRVAYSICGQTPGGEFEDFERYTRFLPMGTGDGMLRFNGIGERVTWGMNNNRNPSPGQKEAFYRIALWAAERGMTMTVHWTDNASVHHLLEVMERVNARHPIGRLRWSIAHLYDASDASLARMKALGVGWLIQNRMYFAGSAYLATRGPAMTRIPPLGSAHRLGLRIGMGTDAHRVMGYNPFVALRWMLDGLTVEGLVTRGADETPSREQALKFYTGGSAWFAHDDDRRGALTEGRLADLAVLSADYLAVPVSRIGEIESLLTMVGGRVVYAAGPYASLAEAAKR